MTLLYQSADFLNHKTGAHPESPERLATVTRRLTPTEEWKACTHKTPKPADLSGIFSIHGADYVAELGEFCEAGGDELRKIQLPHLNLSTLPVLQRELPSRQPRR